jgi:hypothetical protein
MNRRRVGIDGTNYAAAPALVSTDVTPPALAARGVGKGAEALPQQVINNSAAVQQER